MGERLFIRSLIDPPHRRNPKAPLVARCGVSLFTAKEITEAQALVYLKGRRCKTCFAPAVGESRG